jgi:hypothetical protein
VVPRAQPNRKSRPDFFFTSFSVGLEGERVEEGHGAESLIGEEGKVPGGEASVDILSSPDPEMESAKTDKND